MYSKDCSQGAANVMCDTGKGLAYVAPSGPRYAKAAVHLRRRTNIRSAFLAVAGIARYRWALEAGVVVGVSRQGTSTNSSGPTLSVRSNVTVEAIDPPKLGHLLQILGP